jgi:single-stranded-DNA-specific exonuclease
LGFAEGLQILEPYGVGNPMPSFVLKNIYVSEITPVSDGKHTRFVFTDGNSYVSAMYFSNSPKETGVFASDKVDVLFTVDVNEWMGRRSVQLIVKDVKLASDNRDHYDNLRNRYLEINSGASFTDDENVLPSREEFAKLYRFILASLRQGGDNFTHRELISELAKIRDGHEIGFIKLKFMIKVFRELNIIGIEENEEEIYKFKISYSSSKTDLEKSNLLRKLRQQKRKN